MGAGRGGEPWANANLVQRLRDESTEDEAALAQPQVSRAGLSAHARSVWDGYFKVVAAAVVAACGYATGSCHHKSMQLALLATHRVTLLKSPAQALAAPQGPCQQRQWQRRRVAG